MTVEQPSVGPLQIVIVGFETTERFRGDIARELVALRGRGVMRAVVREAGGMLLGQGFLTNEVVMAVGAEIKARADAEAAIELANAARGSALLEALATLADRRHGSGEDRPP